MFHRWVMWPLSVLFVSESVIFSHNRPCEIAFLQCLTPPGDHGQNQYYSLLIKNWFRLCILSFLKVFQMCLSMYDKEIPRLEMNILARHSASFILDRNICTSEEILFIPHGFSWWTLLVFMKMETSHTHTIMYIYKQRHIFFFKFYMRIRVHIGEKSEQWLCSNVRKGVIS